MPQSNVLFLCTGNSARSQMAEALLRHYAGDRFTVYSAGVNPQGINPFTVHVLEEMGFDLSGHKSKHVDELGGTRYYSHIITVCDNARESCPSPLLALGHNKLHWSFDDPAAVQGSDEEKLAKFRAIRDQIDARIKSWVAELEAV